MYTAHNGQITLWMTMMEGQQSLTPHWHRFSIWGAERFTFSFPYQGSQYSVYDYLQPVAPMVTQDTWPTIVDAPLTLIVKIGMGRYRHLFCLYRQRTIPSRLSATYRRCDYPGYMTKNLWCSVDTHFQDEAGSASESFLTITAPNASIMYNYDQINFVLPDLHDLILLTLHWRSFCPWCIRNMQSVDLV